MKASPKKLLPLTLIGIAVTSLFSVQPAQAYTVRLQQMGSNVVATGSGAINLMGLSFTGPGSASTFIAANSGLIFTGPSGSSVDRYIGFTGPLSFGSGGHVLCQHWQRGLCRNDWQFRRRAFSARRLCLW